MAAAGSDAKLSDVRNLVGDIDDAKLTAIMALHPTIEEIEEAVTCVDEGVEVRPNGKWPIQGKVAEICDILVADIDEDGLQ